MRTVKFILVAILAALILIVFLANGDDVIVHVWPDMSDYGLPKSPSYELTTGMVFLGGAFLGFMAGTLREWLREGKIRAQARRASREANQLKSKIDELTAGDDDDIPQLAR